MTSYIAAVEKRQSLQKELFKAAKALVAKMDQMHANSEFNSLFVLAKVHGQEYNGPTYNAEFNALKAVLDRFE